MRKAILFAAALLTLPVLPAVAADNGFYLGGSVGQANLKIDNLTDNVFPDDDFDADDTAFKLIAGIRPLDWFGVEAAYVNFGEPEDDVLGGSLEGGWRRHLGLRSRLPCGRPCRSFREGRPDRLGQQNRGGYLRRRRQRSRLRRRRTVPRARAVDPRRVREVRDQRCRPRHDFRRPHLYVPVMRR